jgi:hypothetical protein
MNSPFTHQPWLCGFNYVPSAAVNSTDMWQEETFDPEVIDRELGWAEEIGFNACRVFLQFLVFESDWRGSMDRFEQFLEIADRHGICTVPIFFDDCAFANKQPYLGRQDSPRPGIHNGCWTPSPGRDRVRDRSKWTQLRSYLQDVISAHRQDPRVAMWDLYNEPGNSDMGNESLSLLRESFGWAREVQPSQPLTAGIWNKDLRDINDALLELSDVVSFHDYTDLESFAVMLEKLEESARGRKIACTEWMARHFDCKYSTHLPLLRRKAIDCFAWGLVRGRTQTHLPWGSTEGAEEPALWFHDLLLPDGSPYDLEEVLNLKSLISDARSCIPR